MRLTAWRTAEAVVLTPTANPRPVAMKDAHKLMQHPAAAHGLEAVRGLMQHMMAPPLPVELLHRAHQSLHVLEEPPDVWWTLAGLPVRCPPDLARPLGIPGAVLGPVAAILLAFATPPAAAMLVAVRSACRENRA